MISKNPEETEALGRALAKKLRAGDVVLLQGELGAGKTVLTRGIARGLGLAGPISSPTFALLNMHEEARIPLNHFDLYRLADADEFYAAGLADAMGEGAISVVEWPEMAWEAMPPARLEIYIAYGAAEGEREITLTPVGGFREVAV